MKPLFETNTICRLCLKVDVQVYRLDNIHHKTFIENIMKVKQYNYVPTEDHYICYICKALLTKTFNFIQTIWNAQEIVCNLSKTADLVTKPMLEYINRLENGLDPITLSSFGNDSCEDRNLNKINKESEVKKVELSMRGPGNQIKQEQNAENSCYINKINSHSTNENSYVSSNSNEDIKEPNGCFLVEIVKCDPLVNNVYKESDDIPEVNNKKSKRKPTKHTDTDECADPKPVTLKGKRQLLLKSRTYKEGSTNSSESNLKRANSSKRERRRKKNDDDDYLPDSISHSEDSQCNLYDDIGRRKKRKYRVYPRQCDHCSYEVSVKADHYRHYQTSHPGIEYPYAREKNYACSICGQLKAKGSISAHEATHIKREIKCTLCPKVFSNTKNMIQHRSSVHPTKTYTCDYCSKIIKTRSEFKLHIRIHTGEKPFKCHICGAGFAHNGNRTIHIRSKHQNNKYVAKKRTPINKERKKEKYNLQDTEINTSDEEPLERLKKRPKSRNIKKKNEAGGKSEDKKPTPKRRRTRSNK